MLHDDNALLYEIVRAAHDPGPRRAARFRPFAPTPAPVLLTDAPVRRAARIDAGSVSAFVRTLAEPFRRLLPTQRAVPVPCC